jgi:predicted transcriptional regulator
MEVEFSPEVQAKLDKLATESGLGQEELVRDALAGYFAELQRVRGMLDERYDEIKSGKVRLIPGDEVFAGLRKRAQRDVL